VVVAGGGFTPTAGLRLGLSVANGLHATSAGHPDADPASIRRGAPGRIVSAAAAHHGESAPSHGLSTTEATFGYRIVPDLTARASYMARRAFTRITWDHQAGVSLVWARQWW
jgi:hypothetical protein